MNQEKPAGHAQPRSVQLPAMPPPPGMPVQWMQRPQPMPGVPPGLEYLTQVDKLLAQQKVDMLEVFTGWEQNNRYVIRNSAAQQVYFAFENTDTCMRVCCGPKRGFTIHIVDNLNQEVMRLSREFKCCAGCSWCAGCCEGCTFEVSVQTATGEVLGYVRQKRTFYKPYFDILDAERKTVLQIQGPCCLFNGPLCPCDSEFQVVSNDGNNTVGKIAKQYGGFVQEMFTTADNFAVDFPMDLNVRVKATLLSALFLIDFMFFEQKNNNHY